MPRNLIIGCLLLLAPYITKAQQTTQNIPLIANTLPGNQVTKDWQTAAQSYISASEYFFNPITGNNNYYVANQKQRIGFIINNAGFTASPVRYTDNPKKEDEWKVNMQLKYIGKGSDNIFESSANQPGFNASENQLVIQHNNFSIEYLNNESGLRQNFIINRKPSGKQDLSILMELTGNLHAVSENNTLQFKDEKGDVKLYYRDLNVWDANHQLLKAEMKIQQDGKLLITVDDSKATYPITVDPINQTPEWTTSADGILPTLVGQSLAVDAAYGFTVVGLGDVNGDGFADVAVGAPALVNIISGTGTLASVGAVFVYYGSANGLPVKPSAVLQPTTAIAGALFGYSIAGGDINNDGKADIIVGAPMDNVSISTGGTSTASGKVGKVYVFNGATLSTNTTPFLTLQLSGNGLLQNGVNLSVKALFGFSVAVTEDLNGDGKKDIIVGSPTYAGIKAGLLGSSILDVQSGGAFVFLSNANDNTRTIVSLQPPQTNLLGLGLLTSNISGLLFGYSVDGLGDYNGDGKPDVVATAPAGINASSISSLLNGKLLQGSAIVYYGTGSGVNTNPGATLTATSGGLLSNLVGSVANAANLFGVAVKGVRDAGGVRNGNVLVGAPLGGAIINVLSLQLKTGTVSVFKKKTSSPSGYVIPDQVLSSPRNSNNILQIIQSNLLFGYSLDNVFDVNCDGISDIIVGEPVSSGVQLINANVAGGAAYVYLGKADGTYQPAPSWTLTAYEDALLGINTTSLIGYSVAGAGKIKGPTDDNHILVGSPSRTLDFGSGLLNLGGTVSTLFSLVAGNNGVGKAFLFDTKECVALNLTKTDALCNGSNTGTVTATFGGGTAPYTISIDNGAFTTATSPTTFNALSAGTHTVTIKDANGSSRSVSITINAPTVINATTTQINPACPGASNGSFTINATGGTGTLTYSKNGGTAYQSSNAFTGLSAGTYNWIVKDSNGCTKSGQVILTDPTAITATATISNPTYFGASNGSFTINATGGTGALTYSKDGGATYQSSNSFIGLTCGTYNWVVKDANGCTKTGQSTLTCPPDITVTVTSNNPLCNGGATGSFTLTASGGTGTLTYSKDGGTTYQSSNTFTGLAAGTYNWVVKDANGYTKSGQIILTNPAAISATTTQVNPTCPGSSNGSFTINATGGTGTLTYSKDGGATYQSSNTFTGLSAGTYNWVVKDANGCTKTGQVILTDPTPISATATGTNPTAGASNGSFTITASGGTGTLSYSKDGGATYQSSNSFTGLTCGTYNWVVKDANGCTKTGQTTLTCPADITVTVTSNNPSCNGSSNGSFTLTASGGTGTLTYSKDGGTTYQSSGTFTGLAAGIYNWVVKDASGFTKGGQVTLTNPTAISATTTHVNPLCPGASNGSFTINAIGGTGTLTYSKDGGATYQSSNSFTGLYAGTYNWIVKDANGCTKSGQVILTDPTPISASATSTNPSAFGASDGSFTINASGGTGTLSYSKDGGSTYQSSSTFSGLPAGTYNWVVKDANGCTTTGQVTLSCPPPATITVTVSVYNPLCNGSSDGNFALTASGGTGTYTYSKDGGTTYQSSNTFNNLGAGTYNWVVKDGNGSTKSGQATLTNPPALSATTNFTSPSTPTATNGSFNIASTGGTPLIRYSKDGGATYQTSGSFTGLGVGTYNWVVRDANGCTVSGQVMLTYTNQSRPEFSATGAAPVTTQNKLDMFPNPANTFVNLSFVPAKTGKSKITLYSIDGKFISSVYSSMTEAGVTYQKQVSTGTLAAGLYIIQFQNENSTTNKKLFIVK